MTLTLKKAIFSVFTSILLIFLFNQVVTTALSGILIAIGIPCLMYVYSNIVFGNNNEKVLLYNFIVKEKFILIKTALLYFFLIIMSETYKEPKLDILVKAQENITIIFLIILCVNSLYAIYVKDNKTFTNIISNNIYTYFLVTWVIGFYGDVLYNWSLNNKSESIAILISVVVSFLAFGNVFKKEYISKESGKFSCAENPKPLSEKDKKYTAVHEIGHAIFYAYLKKIPDDFRVVINNESKGLLGYVTFFENGTIVEEKKYAEWLMFVYLAGNRAEKLIYGDSTLGGMSDYHSWCQLAKKYLKNGHRGVFYINPEHEYEHQENQQKMEKLKLSQEKIIDDFFKGNKELIIEFSDALIEKGNMSKKDCAPFFKKVNIIKEIPFLN